MTKEEFLRWCDVLDRAIKGEHVTIVCPTMRSASNEFKDCRDVCAKIGLANEARKTNGHCEIVIGETIHDGGIDFSTMDRELMTCGDRRDTYWNGVE